MIISLFLTTDLLAQTETTPLRLAITTSTENSGLMAVLNPVFEQEYQTTINTIIAGSGQALKLGAQGDVDVLLIHAPQDETQFIAAGYGIKRHLVMYNDFVLIGPVNDPANIKDSNSILTAFQKLLQSESRFISRGDDSGTHKKEFAIWQQGAFAPTGNWYVESGLGMGATLLLANERQAYTLTDRATYLAFQDKLDLSIHYQGDPILYNPYHVIAINPERHATINHVLAQQYIAFITSAKAKKIIDAYQLHGEQGFYTTTDAKISSSVSTNQTTTDNHFFMDSATASWKLLIDFDPVLFKVVWTSLMVALIAVIIASLISLPLAIVVAFNQFTGKRFLMICLNTLMALPTVVVGLLLYGLLNRQGLLGPIGLLYTPAAMIIGQCILIIPVILNLCIVAINGADPRLARACAALGANCIQRSMIYMSETRFALIAAIVTGFGRAIGEVGIAMMLGGNINGYTRTMTTAIALETSKGDFEFALALGFVLLLVAFIINALLQQFQLQNKS